MTNTNRICAICHKPLSIVVADNGDKVRQGYYCCDEYYCSEDCVNLSLPENITWDEHYDDDGDCYLSEWGIDQKTLDDDDYDPEEVMV